MYNSTKRHWNKLALGISAALFAATATAGDMKTEKNSVANLADDSSITLMGTVATVDDDEFVLSHDTGTITVELDEWDNSWFEDHGELLLGERVMVSGTIDKDLFEKTEIKAKSLWAQDLNTYLYTDERTADADYSIITMWSFDTDYLTTLRGTISEIDGDEFVLNTGISDIRVDTEEMRYDPLDEKGFQKLQIGDRVSVVGDLDKDFLDTVELEATSILTLEDASA